MLELEQRVYSKSSPLETDLQPILAEDSQLRRWRKEQVERIQKGEHFIWSPFFISMAQKIRTIERGLPNVGGVLLVGPKGNGKSSILKEINGIDEVGTTNIYFHYHTAESELTGDRPVVAVGLQKEINEKERVWSPGLIQNAINSRFRAIFGDITTATPRALGGGILDLLSQKRGGEWNVGGQTYRLPKEFRIDATCNPEPGWKLEKIFQERMAVVEMPPIPLYDELLLMSVWLSDKEGRVLLTPEEQSQLIAFMTYTLPALRNLDPSQIDFPFSLRTDEAIAGYLVNQQAKTRTACSLPQAVSLACLQTRGRIDSSLQTNTRIKEVISKTAPYLEQSGMAIFSYQKDGFLLAGAKQSIVEKPFDLALIGLKADEYQRLPLQVKSVNLTEQERQLCLETNSTFQDKLCSATGLIFDLNEEQTKLAISEMGTGSELFALPLPDDLKEKKQLSLLGVSSDGRRILVKSNRPPSINLISIEEEIKTIPLPSSLNALSPLKQILISSEGKAIAQVTQDGKLTVCGETADRTFANIGLIPEVKVATIAFSPRGRLLLATVIDNGQREMFVFDLISQKQNLISPFVLLRLKNFPGKPVFGADSNYVVFINLEGKLVCLQALKINAKI